MSLRAAAGGLLVRRPRNRTLTGSFVPPPGPCFAALITEGGDWLTTEADVGLVTEQCFMPEALVTEDGSWLLTEDGSGLVV